MFLRISAYASAAKPSAITTRTMIPVVHPPIRIWRKASNRNPAAIHTYHHANHAGRPDGRGIALRIAMTARWLVIAGALKLKPEESAGNTDRSDSRAVKLCSKQHAD